MYQLQIVHETVYYLIYIYTRNSIYTAVIVTGFARNTADRGHAVAVGHVGHAIQDAVPAEQVLRGAGGD